jgi:hypothetical protein
MPELPRLELEPALYLLKIPSVQKLLNEGEEGSERKRKRKVFIEARKEGCIPKAYEHQQCN